MENLSEKVYECSLAVEAHMVCDLLANAGISARVEGEFLQSGAGELPLGNLVKVRVDPARAAEAREVIAEWEKQQPPESGPPPVNRTARMRALLWFLAGVMVGVAAAFIALRDKQPMDYESDRNRDGRIDSRWHAGWDGFFNLYEEDNDFDGRFEWKIDVDNGQFTRAVLDTDGDGRPEQVSQFRNGVLATHEYHFASGGRIVKREIYAAGQLDSAEFDDDGDGIFERRVQYDSHGEPRP